MVKGYKSEMDKYTAKIEEAIESLESVLVDGVKQETVIKPLFDSLLKTMEDYSKGVKTIKSAYVSRMQHVTESRYPNYYYTPVAIVPVPRCLAINIKFEN